MSSRLPPNLFGQETRIRGVCPGEGRCWPQLPEGKLYTSSRYTGSCRVRIHGSYNVQKRMMIGFWATHHHYYWVSHCCSSTQYRTKHRHDGLITEFSPNSMQSGDLLLKWRLMGRSSGRLDHDPCPVTINLASLANIELTIIIFPSVVQYDS